MRASKVVLEPQAAECAAATAVPPYRFDLGPVDSRKTVEDVQAGEIAEPAVGDLAVGTDAAVVFPEYDRSPEARYPTAIEQSYAAARWVVDHGDAHGLDPTGIAVAGDSVGGNVAAALTLMAKERGDVPLVQHTSDDGERAEITASPLRATTGQLTGLPPALVITAEADVLRDEGEAYATRLRSAGVPVVATRYQGVIHDFVMLNALRSTHAAQAAIEQATSPLRTAFAPV